MTLKKVCNKRAISVIIALMLLVAQVVNIDINAMATGEKTDNPPTAYPENCIKRLDADFDFEGDFSGGNAFQTKKNFITTNLDKYVSFEYDVFVVSQNKETSIRTYFLDSTHQSTSNSGRGFCSKQIKTNVWQHIIINCGEWETGYGMNGDKTDACAMMTESMGEGNTRIIVKNVCVTSNDIVSPDTYPDKLIAKVVGAVNKVVSITTTEADLSAVFDAIDISYGDNIEIDYYVGTVVTEGIKLSLVLKDKSSKRAVYRFVPQTNKWEHLKLTILDFEMAEGFDAANVCAYSIEGASVSDRLYFDNLCVTGIPWPREYPDGVAKKIGDKFDLLSNGQGGKTTITSYGEKINFSAHDFFEFDIYIESSKSKEKVYYFLYDGTYNEQGSALPKATQRLQHNFVDLPTNEWVHIRTTISDFGERGTGDISNIAGFYLTGLSKNNRYIIVNQCLTDLQVPEAEYKYTLIKAADKNLDYKGTSSVTEKVTFTNAIDLNAGSYLEFDASAVSISENLSATLVLEDEDGKSTESTVAFAANKWKHIQVKLENIENISQLKNLKAIYVKDISGSSRTVIYNLALTDIVTLEMNNKYTLKKSLSIEWTASTDNEKKYLNENKTAFNMAAEEFIEFDILFETEVENPAIRLFFVDENDRKGFFDVTTKDKKSKNGWFHLTLVPSDFDTGWGLNGDRTKVVYFFFEGGIEDGPSVYVRNFCFTYFPKPKLETRFPIVLETDISGTYSKISGGNSTKTISYFNADKSEVDLSQVSHIELDIYIESQEPTRGVRFYFIDSAYKYANEGRGFWGLEFETGKWVHVLLDLSTVETGYGMNGDKTKAIGMMFESWTTDDDKFIFQNIALTKRNTLPINVIDMPETPDKDSMYISDAESLMNDLGIWNSSGIITDSRYKTEAKKSVLITVRGGDGASNSMRFLFNDPCNFSAAQSLRFDLLIDDIALAAKNKIKVQLTSNKRFKDKAFVYYINGADLQFGWNSFDVPLSKFTAQSGADISSIYGLSIGIDNAVLGTNDYFLFGLDNIRVYKSFTVIKEPENNGDNTDIIDNGGNSGLIDTDNSFNGFDNNNNNGDNTPNDNSGTINASGKRKKIIRRKRVGSTGISTDMIVLISVSIACGALLVTGLTLSVLTERKYRRVVRKKQA